MEALTPPPSGDTTAYRLLLLDGGSVEASRRFRHAFSGNGDPVRFELGVFEGVPDLIASLGATERAEAADVVMIGPEQEQPLTAAREIRAEDPQVQFVFLRPAGEVDRFRHTLRFNPLIGDAWTTDVSEETSALRQVAREAAEATRRRRSLGAALDKINVQIAPSEEKSPETTRRRLSASDRYLASLLAHAPDAIISVDLEGRIVAWNDAATEVFGYSHDQAVGTPVLHLFPESREEEVAALLGRVRSGGAVHRHQLLCERADGVRLQGEITLTLVRDEAGGELGIAMIARDVTERVREQRELEEATTRLELLIGELRARTEEAEAASRAKSEFLAVMSHELRTPLQAIIGYIALLEDELGGPVTEAQQEQLGRVRSSADHLLALIDQVLDLSRSEVGTLQVASEVFDLCRLATEAAESVRPQAETAGLTLRVGSCADARFRSVVGDPSRVRQIVLNLLSNAVKFTDAPGEVEMTFEAPKEASEAHLRVWDTGVGITEAEIRKIFEPFYQAEHGLQRETAGMGLGLSISRRLAAAMGGRLEAESRPGPGSVFTLVLPVE